MTPFHWAAVEDDPLRVPLVTFMSQVKQLVCH